ncbi:PrsW family intramembrane metalloprotease [Halopiger goleimassiliensis]|uniref:PrsW family intramembrane metalloprotease n=1 Tax=Halopiger goleimassiliensis TaxID=1293048 RepID=UPI0006779D3D|nr:PrsW family intramembrane metalloprotease [Halopiger goleimassiliensis]
MQRRRDPVERADDESRDLYEVSTWEPRTAVDRLSYLIYAAINYGLHAIVLAVALGITLVILVQPAVLLLAEPWLGVFFALSVVPAALLAAFIWYTDVTSSEPLGLVVATFVLAILFATFAAVVNTAMQPYLEAIPLVGTVLFFVLIVGPIEESVKLLAVRIFAYRSDTFDAVIDGAVYGAIAGLGFAAFENALYITNHVLQSQTGLVTAATGIATVRALVGPGHVIFSAIAGYYLGLAKFNGEHAGPLVVKGLLIAALVHATYNSLAGFLPSLVATVSPVTFGVAQVSYVALFNVAIGAFLYRKLDRYRRTYRSVRDDVADTSRSELTEFEPPQR